MRTNEGRRNATRRRQRWSNAEEDRGRTDCRRCSSNPKRGDERRETAKLNGCDPSYSCGRSSFDREQRIKRSSHLNASALPFTNTYQGQDNQRNTMYINNLTNRQKIIKPRLEQWPVKKRYVRCRNKNLIDYIRRSREKSTFLSDYITSMLLYE